MRNVARKCLSAAAADCAVVAGSRRRQPVECSVRNERDPRPVGWYVTMRFADTARPIFSFFARVLVDRWPEAAVFGV